MKRFLGKAVLAGSVGLLTLIGLEVILPFAIRVTDDIEREALPGVGLRFKPKQSGIYLRAGIEGNYRINAQGFNNPQDYALRKQPGVTRVAIAGDSFVEALQVDQAEALFSVLEKELRSKVGAAEVYSFGISGFGTAQVYHLLRDYVLAYSPDFVVYLFIANDVADSSVCGDSTLWYPRYRLGDDDELVAIPAREYRLDGYKRFLKRSDLFRYIFYQRRLLERITLWRRGLETKRGQTTDNTPGRSCNEESWHIVEKLLVEIHTMLHEHDVPWLLVWQGDDDPRFREETRRRLEEIAQTHDLPYYDPTPAFIADYQIHRQPFRIPDDGHWYASGHRVVGRALADMVP